MREGGHKGGREEARKGGHDGGREEAREGGREGGHEGGREVKREGGGEGGRPRGRARWTTAPRVYARVSVAPRGGTALHRARPKKWLARMRAPPTPRRRCHTPRFCEQVLESNGGGGWGADNVRK